MSRAIRRAAPPGAAIGTPSAGTAGRASLALSLPEIDRAVAVELPTCADSAWWARLALLWIDDIPADLAGLPPNRMVETAVARWIDRITGGRRVTMDFDVCIAPAVDLAVGWLNAGVEPADHWYFAYSHTHSQFWAMHRLDELESAIPGLGETAWWLIGAAAVRTVSGITPETATHRAEYAWWYGMCTQEDLEDELECMEMSAEEIANYPSIDWWEQSFPEQIRNPQRRFNTRRLFELAENCEAGFVRDCAALLAAMSRLIDRNAQLPHLDSELVDGESIHLGVILTPAPDDVAMERLTDDWYDMANQSGGDGWQEAYGLEAVGFDRMAFRRWKVRMERGLQLFATLDRFVELAGVHFGE